ncbi:MAG TPA: ATP-binding protein [Gemmataceae bacterium]|nr:ATP-binding protein [Gemmataceae bacterium]
MFTRRLALKLLAPTVLVSLLLVAACIAGALYLIRSHDALSAVLSENIDSTQTARDLLKAVENLRDGLLGDHSNATDTAERLVGLNTAVRERLQRARDLANLEGEKQLTKQIGDALDAYYQAWDRRASVPPAERVAYDRKLAEQLEEGQVRQNCMKLRDYNTDQVAAADRSVTSLAWGLPVVAVVAPLSGLALGYIMARSIYHSMYQLNVRIRDAAGRLSGETPPLLLGKPGDLPDLDGQMQGVIEEMERVVSRLQQRERDVLRREQLAAVGQVAAGVAHELRNPLTSVKMLVQAGMEGSKPTGLAHDDLAIIEHEVLRMEACIQTFLDFARPPHAEPRRTDLLAVVRRAAALVEGRARRQKVRCVLNLPPGPIEMQIDANQIQQVLVNLLLNALDAMPQGGVIHAEARAPGRGADVEVEVRDDGPGVAPEVMKRLFEPFVSTKETGLGLGLSICRRLVEAHGGAIHGGNGSDGGAVFTFALPTTGELDSPLRHKGHKEER